MRWYYIKFTPTEQAPNPNVSGFVLEYGSSVQTQTLFNPNGANLPGALEVEFNFEVSAFDQRIPDGQIKIYNPPLPVLQNADKYRGMTVEVRAGFASYDGVGLPLANVSQSGLIGYGKVSVSFANWVGGDMALNLVISPALQGIPSIAENPVSSAPYQFVWKKGQTFEEAITATFKPLGYEKLGIQLDPELKWPGYNVIITANDLISFSNQLRRATADLVPTTYLNGVSLILQSPGVIVVSNTTKSPTTTIQIQPQDVVGQPTISYTGEFIAVQSVHPLRADIRAGMGIMLNGVYPLFNPTSPFNNTKPLTLADKTLFVQKVRQVGKFRDNSYQGWVTVLDSGIIQS